MTKQYTETAMEKGETGMTEYIEREEKCGDCIHVEVCDPIFAEFSRENPAHCKNFMKAAEVALVRHGRWIKENSRKKSYLWICSNCRKIAYFCSGDGKCAYQYCPNCGADMSKEDEDE